MDKPTFKELWERFNACLPFGDVLTDEQITALHLITKHFPDRAEKILRKRVKAKRNELQPHKIIANLPKSKITQKHVWM